MCIRDRTPLVKYRKGEEKCPLEMNIPMISAKMCIRDSDSIPNFQNIDEEYRNADYDPENAYTVPYMLCTTRCV